MSDQLDIFHAADAFADAIAIEAAGGNIVAGPITPSFDTWYERYPRKQGKAKARERWAKMSAAERASAWMALDGWVEYARVAGTTYVPYASTWLNQARWEDAPPEVPQQERREAPGMAAVRRVLGR